MKKHLTAIATSLFLLLPLTLHAEEDVVVNNEPSPIQYVKEDAATIPARRAASSASRVLFYLSNGDKVTYLTLSPGKTYTQVKNEKDQVGWVQTQLLQPEMSAKYKKIELENQIVNLTNKIDMLENSESSEFLKLKREVARLTEENSQLVQENADLKIVNHEQQTKIGNLSVLADQNEQKRILKWFTYGGSLALIAFLLGIIAPRLVPQRRDRRSKW